MIQGLEPCGYLSWNGCLTLFDSCLINIVISHSIGAQKTRIFFERDEGRIFGLFHCVCMHEVRRKSNTHNMIVNVLFLYTSPFSIPSGIAERIVVESTST